LSFVFTQNEKQIVNKLRNTLCNRWCVTTVLQMLVAKVCSMQQQNDIPSNITFSDLESEIFKPALKDYLLAEFFYSVQ